MSDTPGKGDEAMGELLKSLQSEVARVYEWLKTTDRERIDAVGKLNAALLELGPARFNSKHYQTLKNENRIIELDFAVRPKSRSWSTSPHMQRLVRDLDSRRSEWQDVLRMFSKYEKQLSAIPLHGPADSQAPHWLNGWIPGLDAVSLYAFTAENNPAIFLEVGSGNSTKFVRRAISDHGLRTKIVSIDPNPRAEIDEICDTVHRVGLEDLDLSVFDILTSGDIVFIDNSHRSFPNSDVTVFFLEVLGRLPKGILYGLHDIFLPVDYPEEWGPRFYNEQYLLAAYLFGGGDRDTIAMPGSFISRDAVLTAALDVLWKAPHLEGILPFGGAFWMRKG